ncbi:MAG: hypothetical protein R3C56_12520 [Pirellulaceae bacterium]
MDCAINLDSPDKLHRSQHLSYEQLALVETLAIGCHACDRGGASEGDHVLIIGAGPIGLATLEFTRLTGAKISGDGHGAIAVGVLSPSLRCAAYYPLHGRRQRIGKDASNNRR